MVILAQDLVIQKKHYNESRWIKIILSILFFLCLFDMPYGYYQLIRFAALIGFGVLAYQAKEQQNDRMMFVYGALALLFQPFIKIALGRELWNIIDFIVGIWLMVSVLRFKNDKKI